MLNWKTVQSTHHSTKQYPQMLQKFSFGWSTYIFQSHRLHKIFSSNTVRVSYSCMQNMYKTYKEYNSKITSTPCNQLTLCNCRVKEEFPMDGKCQTLDAVYDCRFTSSEPRRIYFKLAEGNGRKGIIIIKSHSTTNHIHMRRYF